jgi:hypothetical protein
MTAQTDEMTRQELLRLMRELLGRLRTVSRELADISVNARHDLAKLQIELNRLAITLKEEEKQVENLCRLVTTAVLIEPVWNLIVPKLNGESNGEST